MLSRLWRRCGTAVFWVCWPLLFLYLRPSHRTRMVVRAGGQLLLVRGWLSDGKWGLPGGGLHRGETPLAGAVRELREETGLAATSLVELATEPLRYHGLRFTCTYFLADIQQADTIQRQPLEISDIRWFHPSEVAAANFQPEVRRALKLLVERRLF